MSEALVIPGGRRFLRETSHTIDGWITLLTLLDLLSSALAEEALVDLGPVQNFT